MSSALSGTSSSALVRAELDQPSASVVHGVDVALVPGDVLSLPPPRWFESRAVGRGLGAGALMFGLCALGYAALRGSAGEVARVAAAGAGVAAGGVAYWLFTRRYMRDPEALRDYLQEYAHTPLHEGFTRLRWDVPYLVALVGRDALRTRLLHELRTLSPRGLASLWKRYGGERIIGALLAYELLSRDFVLEQFALDRASPPPSAPSLLACVALYGAWLVRVCHVDPASLAAAVDADPASRALTWPALHALHVDELYAAHLVSRTLLQPALLQHLATHGMSATLELTRTGSASEMPWWLGDGATAVVSPEQVASHARASLLAAADIVAEVAAPTAVWATLLTTHGARLGIAEHERAYLLEVRSTWTRLLAEQKSRDESDTERRDAELRRVQLERSGASASEQAQRETEWARMEQSARDECQRRVTHRTQRLARLRTAFHTNWTRVWQGQPPLPLDLNLDSDAESPVTSASTATTGTSVSTSSAQAHSQSSTSASNVNVVHVTLPAQPYYPAPAPQQLPQQPLYAQPQPLPVYQYVPHEQLPQQYAYPAMPYATPAQTFPAAPSTPAPSHSSPSAPPADFG